MHITSRMFVEHFTLHVSRTDFIRYATHSNIPQKSSGPLFFKRSHRYTMGSGETAETLRLFIIHSHIRLVSSMFL